jgi:hypothetical protein
MNNTYKGFIHMARTLVSPGVSVEVIDESFYAPSGPGTVPLVLLATQENKTNPSGSVAEGTLPENAGKVYLVTSRRDLLNLFGSPVFPKNASGNAILASELSEYGLLTAHSALEVSSRAYVVRADIDLAQLTASSTRPTGDVAAGTMWLDTGTNNWGIFEWDLLNEGFTRIIPRVITSTTELTGSVPKTSIGQVGDYAVVATNTANPVYYKNTDGVWVLVGSTSWQNSWAAVTGTAFNPVLLPGSSITINTEVVTLSGSSVISCASNINSAAIPGVTASGDSGYLEIFVTGAATSDGSSIDGLMRISNTTGFPLTALGITPKTYASPAVQQSAHTSVPEWKSFDATPRPTGAVWVKTTAVASGANFSVYKWSSNANRWLLQAAPLYENDVASLRALDPTRGGLGIASGALYVQFDTNDNNTVTYKVFERGETGKTVVTGTITSPTVVPTEEFEIAASLVGSSALPAYTTVTMTGDSAEEFVADLLAAGITNVNAYVNSAGAVVIEHTKGGVIYMKNTAGTPLADIGITSSNEFCRSGPASYIIASNWVAATYLAQGTAPVDNPSDGTLWYYGTPIVADILVHDGTGWAGYQNVISDSRGFDLSQTDPNGPLIAASAPTQQSDNTALKYGDLWIDTSDLENYPRVYRWQSSGGEDRWIAIDAADSTSENGIIFADARWDTDGESDPVLDALPLITDLLSSDYVDLDAPDPGVYPRGMLLFNTRRSSYNVKEYHANYYNVDDFQLEILPTIRDAWVSISGSRSNGVPYFGRKAVRNMVVQSLKSAITLNEEAREDSRFFNLISAPGYPELTQNLIELNTARRETAFIIADLPMGLASDAITVENYITNSRGQPEDTEDGLATNNPFVAAYYPSAALANDTTGTQVAVPASHLMLRTFIKNDNRAFPWFAPAGEQRGTIDNATQIGYVNRATGQFVRVGTKEGLRDLLYANKVNPIAEFSGFGLMAYGQKTRASANTALDRINVSRLIAYVRYQLERITKPLIFEPNDRITRNEAKQAVESLLNDILASRGLYDYLVVCDESNNTPERIDRNELHIDIAIEPTKAVEFIYIPVRVKNTGEIASGNNVTANAV